MEGNREDGIIRIYQFDIIQFYVIFNYHFNHIIIMNPIIGFIFMSGFNWAPKDFGLCQGGLLAISDNTALFSLISNIFGGNGRSNFALPDLRGRMPVGQGSGPGLTTRYMGETGGLESVILTVDQMPTHNHPVSSSTSPTATSTASWSNATIDVGGVPARAATGTTNTPNGSVSPAKAVDGLNSIDIYGAEDGTTIPNGSATLSSLDISVNTTVSLSNLSTGDTGGSTAHQNMSPFTVVNFVIALDGVYPSRN